MKGPLSLCRKWIIKRNSIMWSTRRLFSHGIQPLSQYHSDFEGRIPAGSTLLDWRVAMAVSGAFVGAASCLTGVAAENRIDDMETVTNWSGTHEVDIHPSDFIQPQNLTELEAVVKRAHETGQKIRPIGSGISPNGLALCSEGMLSLAAMDRIIHVDKEKMQVRVEAGARVEQVVEALRPHSLTLQNYASVRQQQIGGFIQVSAHGTGMDIPPVDEQVVSFKLVTPGKGSLELNSKNNPELFRLARCCLGTLGIVAEVTLQCVPAHQLFEQTFVSNLEDIRLNHRKWLKEWQHIRYMWIPYTDSVVVVRSAPIGKGLAAMFQVAEKDKVKKLEAECVEHVVQFYLSSVAALPQKEGLRILTENELRSMHFTQLRDELLALNPLDQQYVAAINQQEARYWTLKSGTRIGWSDEILGFDCGGQQWVSEICFPVYPPAWDSAANGKGAEEYNPDIEYMVELLKLIEQHQIPAPAPIEQRWTAGSHSPLSPAAISAQENVKENLFSWIGIIMYLPSNGSESQDLQRAEITKRFFEYKYLTAITLWDKYKAHEHWAKIEMPENWIVRQWLSARIQNKFPMERLNYWREELDPNNILLNQLTHQLISKKQK